MPEEPPQGVKFSTAACTPSLTPMVAKAKKAPRSRRMPSPKISARMLTQMPATSRLMPSGQACALTSQTQM
jgi:hypothetical protein